VGVLLCALAPFSMLAQGIRAVQEDGRTIFVNDADPQPLTRRTTKKATWAPAGTSRAAQTAASAKARAALAGDPSEPAKFRNANVRTFVYWSNTEKRWKPLPGPSPNVLRRAQNAAAEVQQLVDSHPSDPEAGLPGAPDSHPSKPEAGLPGAPDSRPAAGYTQLAAGRAISSQDIDRIITDAAGRHQVDPNLVRALIRVESNYNPMAISRKGAMGLMQLMPDTARKFNVSNPFNPQQNVEAGVQLLRTLLDNFGGNVPLALAAYNAGEGAVNRNHGVPAYAETRNYVRRISGFYGGQMGLPFSAARIRVSRNSFGVLTISNVE
jgi:hypothetical protein